MTKLRICVVSIRNKVAYGDSIRIDRIFEFLRKKDVEVMDVRFPAITRDTLRECTILKIAFLNIFPLHKLSTFSGVLKVKDIVRIVTFNIYLNYLVPKMRKLKPDVILAETSLVGWVAALASKKISVPCVIDVHGLIFAEAKGSERKDWLDILNMEEDAFEKSDHLLVVSQRMKKWLSEKLGISNKKMTLMTNGSDPQLSTAQYQYPLKVIYAGIFSYWEKVNDFLDIAKRANPDAFRFYLAGAGTMKNQLLKRIEDENIPVKYLGYVPKQKIREILAQMNVGIAPSTRDLARQVASPIKIYDYLAAGLPVLTPKIGDWGDLIDNQDCGISLKDDSIKEYVRALNKLVYKDEWIKKSHNAVKVIEKEYSWDVVLEPLHALDRLTEKSRYEHNVKFAEVKLRDIK